MQKKEKKIVASVSSKQFWFDVSVKIMLTIMIFSNMKAVCPAASLSSLLSLLFSSCRARFLSSSSVTFSVDSGLWKRDRVVMEFCCLPNWPFEISLLHTVRGMNCYLTQRALGQHLHGHEATSPGAPEPKAGNQSDI